jgi:hypothetical protein
MVRVFLVSLSLLFSYSIKAQTWLRIFQDIHNSNADYVIENYDKGYLLIGSINYIYTWLIKTDINGNMLWNKKFGDGQHELIPVNIESTLDHGYIIGANTSKYSTNDACIFKLNSCGELEWCNVIYTPSFGFDYGGQAKPTPDGGYIFYRLDEKYNTNRDHLYKFDSSGQLLWHQQITTNPLAFGEDVYDLIVDSTGIFLNGNCYFPDPGQTIGVERFYLVKTDTTGQKHWGVVYGDSTYYYGYSICSIKGSSGNYYAFGWRDDLVSGNSFPALVKVLGNGTPSYNKDIFTTSSGGINTSRWLNDTVIILGGTIPINSSVSQVIILKTDTLGNLKLMVTLPQLTNGFESTAKTFDNKFVSTGDMWSVTKEVIYLIKVNSALQFDSVYSHLFTYDSLCSHTITSDTINPDCGLIVNVEEPFNNPETTLLKVYPNPTSEFLVVELPKYLKVQNNSSNFQSTTIYHQWKSTTLEAYNLNNKLVFRKEIPKDQTRLELDVSAWGKGMYFFRLSYNKNTVAGEKVIIE